MDQVKVKSPSTGTRSPWVTAAQQARLPYKVYASLNTDKRVVREPETANDILRRTLPR